MKPILFAILFVLTVSCGTVVTVDTQNDFRMKVITETGMEVDMTCHVGLTTDEGVKLDSECIGFFADGGNTYRCSVAVGSDKQPVTKRISIKESCEIVVAK